MNALLVGRHDDRHVELLRSALRLRCSVKVLHLGLPAARYRCRVDNARVDIGVDDVTYGLADASSGLLMALPFAVNRPPLVATDDAFAAREWDTTLRAAFAAWGEVNEAGWFIAPDADRLQDSKPYLMLLAARLGLPVPRWTIATSVEPRQLPVVGKAINGWQEVAAGRYFNTTRLTSRQFDSLTRQDLTTPTFIQDYIPHRVELRVFCVGDGVVAVRKEARSDETDFRLVHTSEAMKVSVVDRNVLPATFTGGLRALMARLSVQYCCFDVAIDGSEYWLLDVNPTGTWAYLHDDFGLDITPLLVELMVDDD
jgi:glutathione synthase/RimK-type ligase-like ATP-grasp enzyme